MKLDFEKQYAIRMSQCLLPCWREKQLRRLGAIGLVRERFWRGVLNMVRAAGILVDPTTADALGENLIRNLFLHTEIRRKSN